MLLHGTVRLASGHLQLRHTSWGVPTVPVPCTSCKQTKTVRRPRSQRIPGDFTCRVLSQPLATLMEQHDHHAQEAPASWASLLITCGLMFVGAYGCGMLPRWLPNQQRLSSSVNAVGAGLLLGSALCIILPEGFQAAVEGDAPSWAVSATLLSGFWLMMLLDSLSHWLPGGDQHTHSSSNSRGTGMADIISSSVLELSEPADARVLPAGGKTPMVRPGRLIIGSRDAGGSAGGGEEHTVLLTDFAMEQDAAAAGDETSGAAHVQNTPSWRPGSSPTKSRAAARSATLPNTPVTSAGGTATAAGGGGGGGGGGAVSGGGGGTPGGSSVRRLASASGGGGFTTPAGSATARGGGAGAAGSSSSNTTAAAAEVTDAAVVSSSGRDHVLLRSGSGLPLSSKAGGGGLGSGQEWWRPWVVDPTHHALLGLLVHSVSDGLAVGAASLSSVPEVALGVATAMVVHKGPVALGLATFLRGLPGRLHRCIEVCCYSLLPRPLRPS